LKNNNFCSLKVHIRTYGCQMNKYDSELITGLLSGQGFELTNERSDADVLLINTCGVREHAANRALADIDQMIAWKRKRKGRVVGMLGCLSRFVGDQLLDAQPELDIMIGPDAYRQLPALIANAATGELSAPTTRLDIIADETYGDITPMREPAVRAWVAISRGCDNHCSYCMVPMARGPVRCRSVDEILKEIAEAVEDGFPEVILLGQNVNAYESKGVKFGGLLKQVSQIPGLKRVRFMTSHPKDLDDELIEALAQGGVICPALHLPVQSGSDRVLNRMKRGYSRSYYLSLVEKLRKSVTDIALSTDAIVGFPGETEEDFNQTLSLFEEVGYASGFVFRYSPRAGTTAFDWHDDVEEHRKTERLMRLNEQLESSRRRLHLSLIGKKLNVLFEGTARKYPGQMTGRSKEGFVVAVSKGNLCPGEDAQVLIKDTSGFTLLGEVITN